MRLKDYENQARAIVDKMSIREKAQFAVGKDFWHFHGMPKYGLPEVMVTDGPHGLRKIPEGKASTDLGDAVPTTAFPTGCTTASSFNKEIMYEMGSAIAEECIQEKVAVILGPGANHKRSPLCGRNFEYFSEDPYLSGKIAAGLINGIEDGGVGTSLKHYAANNQEYARMNSDSIIDDRAYHEIYTRQFEIAMKEAQPATTMVSYNRINGVFGSDNYHNMTELARNKWGYEGMFITDWGAVNKLVEGYNAGLDVEMPGSAQDRITAVVDGVVNGKIPMERLDQSALLMVELLLRYKDLKGKGHPCNMAAHADLAAKIAEESAVLLKNEDGILPLDTSKKIGVFGNMAKMPRYQGSGSSQLNPYILDTPYDSLRAAGLDVSFSIGYAHEETVSDEAKMVAAEKLAAEVDTCLIFAGLPESFESEGYERKSLDMPQSHIDLINRVAAVNPNVVVVLMMGSPVTMPWLPSAKGVLNAYLSGGNGGRAIVNLLTGKANPSGRLSETFPLKLEDTPCYGEYSNNRFFTKYKESIYTGYRYYDTAEKEVLFPFGYGLSYTTFDYSNLTVSAKEIADTDTVTVTVDVTNTGAVAGKEVVQLYVGQQNPTLFKAKKELKGFTKVALEPGETKTVSFELDSTAFDYYNVNLKDFHVETGDYTISIAKNVSEVVLSEDIHVNSTVEAVIPDYHRTAPEYYDFKGVAKDISDNSFSNLCGRPIVTYHSNKPITQNTTFVELADGKVVALIKKGMELAGLTKDAAIGNMIDAMIPDIPLKSARMGGIGYKPLGVILGILNGKPLDGIKGLFK